MVNCAPNCPRGNIDKTKEWQMEMLMEKLRSKANQYRSFYDSAKALRMTLLEKRFSIDNVERNQLQKCLDTLQQNMKVTTHQAMVERLESVSRQLGLKFVTGPSELDLFISSDMFYLEVLLEPNGGVKDVKIHHEGRSDQQPQSCEELVACLSRKDFADFTAQLEGLSSIYQLNVDKKTKTKAYTALTSLETDLILIASIHSYIKDPYAVVHNSPLGYLEKRRGGHPMKLTYFVPPFELLDPKQRCLKPLVLEPGFNLGYSVSVCVESSSAHKLQTATLVSINRTSNGNCESYSSLNSSNSMTVAGCFVLTLKKPMPICIDIVECLEKVTGSQVINIKGSQPLLSMVTENAANGAHTDSSRGLFVNIGDQHHCYLMTESKNLNAVMVSSVPFTHPSHIPQIITLLRQQALFNTVIASCVRPNTRQDVEKMMMFEVTPLTWQYLSITLEHPLEECMATVELNLTDISNLTCKVYTSSGENGIGNSEYATKVFQRSMSIPVTMRSLIRLWNMQAQRMTGYYNGGLGGSGASGGGGIGHPDVEFDPDLKMKLEPGSLGGSGFVGKQSGDCEDEVSEKDMMDEEMRMEEGRRSRKRKRKSEGGWSSPKGARYEDSMDTGIETSSCDSTPLGTPAPPPPPSSQLEFIPTTDLTDLVDKPIEIDHDSQGEDLLKAMKKKRREEKKTAADIILDLENKNLVPPSVSITPISSSQFTTPSYSVLSEMGLERRPGIEIIPLPSAGTTPLPSSITITPIPNKSEERKSEKKSSKSRSDTKVKLEKKKKRKREDSPTMGPPEKLPPKSDPLTKPVSVSIKPTESLSPRPSSPAGISRKYSSSPSPTHTSPLALSSVTGKSSPTLSKSVKASPKHSPAYNTNSPKNSLTSSPKHGTSSPKHQSSSGKPSLSALKSAVTSPSKSESKSKSKEGKDRDKKSSSSGYSSPKAKSSSSSGVKVKQLDLGGGEGSPSSVQSGGSTSPGHPGDGGKSSAPGQIKNRKSSLSAVIDKLKSAHHVSDEPKRDSKERTSSSTSSSAKVDGKGLVKPGENKSGEYSVKQSSDGMKLTINKTKSKESSKSKSGSSDSPKSHTSVKQGASNLSKKFQHSSSKSSVSVKSSSSSSKSLVKSSSSSSLKSIKPSGSPKTGDRSKDKNRINKDKSIFSSSKLDSRKMSPSSMRDEDSFKSFPSSLSITPQLGDELSAALSNYKQLDRNYQIPKLSARNNPDDKKSSKEGRSTDSPKVGDNKDSKYSSSKNEEGRGGESKSKSYYPSNMSPKVIATKLPALDLSDSPTISIIPVSSKDDRDKSGSGSVEDIMNSLKMDLPISAISLTPVIQDKDDSKKKLEVNDLLLDLTGGSKPIPEPKERSRKVSPPLPATSFPSSPSVSVHIVKSPAPTGSPLVVSSPRSSPTFIDDDELMDEAVVSNCK